MAEVQRHLIDLAELAKHEPHFKVGHIVGCTCGWFVFGLEPEWKQFLGHLPAFGASGLLVLNEEDIRWLKQQKISE